jgi:hypothetical protein
MATSTSVSPYFDDYSEDKNFYRVLYKPGVAIQSRELNQSQTILQNQIKRVGDYLFNNGQRIKGSNPSVNLDARTVRLTGKNINGQNIVLDNFLGKYVTSLNTDIIGYVEFVFERDDPQIGDLPCIVISLKKFNDTNNGFFFELDTLYFHNTLTEALNNTSTLLTAVTEQNIVKNITSTATQYSKTINFASATTQVEVGDLLVHPSLSKPIYVTKIVNATSVNINLAPGVNITAENIQFIKKSSCPTSIVTQPNTYFYNDGFLLRSDTQSVVPDKNTAFPSKVIGFYVTEQIITSEDDPSLLDPAIGSSNYFATGADRLKISLSLTTFDVDEDYKAKTTDTIIPLLTFNRGDIEIVSENNISGELRKELEDRTYDQSGNYVVNSFIVTPSADMTEDEYLRFDVSPGKAYVGGKEVGTISTTQLLVPRPTTTDTRLGYNITTTQGNYIQVTDVNSYGSSTIIPLPETITQGEMFLEMHNVTNPTSNTTQVGTLAFKSLEYDSSLGANSKTQFKLLYHYYSQIVDAPATWSAWATRYRIAEADGQYIADTFFSSPNASTLLGNFGPASTPCYALYREPKVDEVAYWYTIWNDIDKRDIQITKSRFALFYLANTTDSDYSRMISSTKTYLSVSNGSPFYDGLINAKKVKSLIGVQNSLTNHYTAATYTAPFFYANVAEQSISTTGDLLIKDPRPSDLLIFPISKDYIKKLDKINTNYYRSIRGAVFSGGLYTKTLSSPETFALGDGTVVASTARKNFTVIVKSGATANTKLGVANFERGSVTISSDSSTAAISLNDASFTGVADIIYLVESNNVPPRTKTLVKDASTFVNVIQPDLAYSLYISDIAGFGGIYKQGAVTSLSGVWDSNVSYTYNQQVIKNGLVYTAISPSKGTDVSDSNVWSKVNQITGNILILNNGQKDSWYDHGYIKYDGPTAGRPGNILVIFDYFNHSGEGPITVNSYPENYYRNIGTYKSVVDAKEYQLRDCLDFRPKRTNGSSYLNFDTAIFPSTDVNTEADVTYYLPRIDKLYLSKDSVNFETPYDKFFIANGSESNKPGTTPLVADKTKLAIATIELPPYAETAFSCSIIYENNTRFTMADIGKIQQTTLRLDRAVKVHSIEIANLKAIIQNDAGDTLLKSGILVDNFEDFSKTDILTGGFFCALNTKQGICYPMFSAYNVDLKITSQTNVNIANDIITAKYVEEVLVSQVEANGAVNPNPGGINDRRGRAELSQQNSYKVNLLQTGLQLYGTYLLGQGLVAAGVAAFQTGATVSSVWTAAVDAVTGSALSPSSLITYAKNAYEFATSGTIGSTITAGFNTVVGWFTGSAAATTAGAAVSPYVAAQAAANAAAGSASASAAAVSSPWAAAVPYVALVLAVDAMTGGHIMHEVSNVVDSVGNELNNAVSSVSNFVNNPVKSIKKLLSDIRTKEKIKFIKQVKPGLNLYSFEYKTKFKNHPLAGPGRYIGFMAHEVEKLYPNAVEIQDNGYKSVNYSLIGI